MPVLQGAAALANDVSVPSRLRGTRPLRPPGAGLILVQTDVRALGLQTERPEFTTEFTLTLG